MIQVETAVKAFGFCVIVFGSMLAGWLVRESKITYIQPTVFQQQSYLSGLVNSRYDCGVIDGMAGSKFDRALNNWCNDQEAKLYFKELK